MPEIKTDGGTVSIDAPPSTCPICHHASSPIFLDATANSDIRGSNTQIDAAYKCPASSCRRLFIAIYRKKSINGGTTTTFYLQTLLPKNYKPTIHEEQISENFPNFIKIYTQSEIAESENLDEIAGVGYRKALEFLIKDYCIHKNPEKEETIKKTQLGNVIENFVEDANIKICAKRATWLGNDATHYIKKWEDRDINDLKVLIKLSCGWINNNLLTEKYLNEMQ
ncbi:hypothetical protein AU05_21100 [Ectopseudomonas composti]|uniref:DUF4145 domain-containing protein n=1 Tax=Ectopseudomonas composti TaxID=658457 RepID=A0ABP3C247_9GAMM|nr:DUF4145 domain-containing protein [Pseudomonas composti]EZH83633.1 hypothetical protein AU05_21100 [Pseudomonas composti]